MNEFEDSDLVRRALSGDEDAYTELVRRHQSMVAGVVLKMTRRPEWVEDLSQEAFLKAFSGLSRFKKKSGFSTWLYRITVNVSLDEIRKRDSRRRLISQATDEPSMPDSIIGRTGADGERLVLTRETQKKVRDSLERLSPEYRAVLVLRYLEELSTPEIAETLELPEGTVRSRLYYARIELSGILSKVEEQADPRKRREQ